MSILPSRGKGRPITSPPSQGVRKVSLTFESYEVQAVTIVPEESVNGKSAFSIVLEVDLSSGRVGTRRKEGVRSITVPVEPKDIPVLATLAGRPIGVTHWIDESLKNQDDLVNSLAELEKERDDLLRKLEEMRKQVHLLVEGSR